MALDEVFPSSSNRSNSERVSSREAAPSKVSVKYRAAYQSAEMRRGILSNELQDTVAELDAVGKKKQNLLSGHATQIYFMFYANRFKSANVL